MDLNSTSEIEMIEGINRFGQLKEPPLFILGVTRSGTTWVLDIFGHHPLVATVSESSLFSSVAERLMGDNLWKGAGYGLGRYMSRETMRQHVRNLAEVLFSHAMGPEHYYLAEKSPAHMMHIDLIAEVFPEARFLHVLRDGRDVAVSTHAAAKTWAPGWKENFGRNTYTIAVNWKRSIVHLRQRQERLEDRFLEIRYEELHANPLECYQQIFNFARIPFDDAILRKIFEETNFERNYVASDARFRRSGRVGDWRLYFTPLDSLIFNYSAGRALIEFGYERNRFWMSPLMGPRRRFTVSRNHD